MLQEIAINHTIYFLVLTILWLTVWASVFWFFENRRRRGPLLRRLTRTQRVLLFCVLLTVPCNYCLSYAPFLRLLGTMPYLRAELGALQDLYVPVQWLMDHTALRTPLTLWADLWRVAPGVRERSVWGTNPPWLFAAGWIAIGSIWIVLPPYLFHRLLNVWRIRRTVTTLDAP